MMLEQIERKQRALQAAVAARAADAAVPAAECKTIGLLIPPRVREEILAVQKHRKMRTYKEAVHFCIAVGLETLKGT